MSNVSIAIAYMAPSFLMRQTMPGVKRHTGALATLPESIAVWHNDQQLAVSGEREIREREREREREITMLLPANKSDRICQ